MDLEEVDGGLVGLNRQDAVWFEILLLRLLRTEKYSTE